jgi:hypothetical protein
MKAVKSRKLLLGAILALASPLLLPNTVRAADHGDAPSLAHDQAADIADVFFFMDPNNTNDANDKVILIGTVHGFIAPGEASNFGIFDPALRYRFEIENTGDARADKFIDVNFSPRTNDTLVANSTVLQVPKAQTAVIRIPRLNTFLPGTFTAGTLNPTLTFPATNPTNAVVDLKRGTVSTGIKFFAGIVDDPFFFDIPAFSQYISSVRGGSPNAALFNRGRDSFGGYNILAIALSIPKALLTHGTNNTVGVRFVTQRRTLETPTGVGTTLSRGAFRTVDSIGNPAVNVALIPFNRKNAFNPAPPTAIGRFAGDILATLGALGTNGANTAVLASVAVSKGDYLHLNTSVQNNPADKIGGGAPGQGTGFPNGRRLRDDTVDILLSLIGNQPLEQVVPGNYALGDHVDASVSQFPQTATFPFLAPAQQPRDPSDPTVVPTLHIDDFTRN